MVESYWDIRSDRVENVFSDSWCNNQCKGTAYDKKVCDTDMFTLYDLIRDMQNSQAWAIDTKLINRL